MTCEIIIPVWNELQLTKECIDSIIENTHYPYRLIIIDNGSQDQTKSYLEELKKKGDMEVTLIRNEENLGFVKAVNQGLRVSSALYVCILNNDTLVADGWLEEMIEVTKNNPQIGIINPSSNSLGQYLSKGDSIESYAIRLKQFKGQWGEMAQCSGFCMLIKREVIDRLGFFDEVYQIGYCEETDYCRRAQRSGFIFARARAAYVYHKERSTFDRMPDREEIFRRNQDILFRRWGKPLRIAYLVSNSLKDRPKEQRVKKISLAIARDNHQAWLFLKKSLGQLNEMIEHSNIRYFWLADTLYRLTCIYKILKRKRKKKIDIILTEDRILNNILRKLKFYHQADILFDPQLERVRELCKERSRYP
jgi:GT2 family glycosyltransferase